MTKSKDELVVLLHGILRSKTDMLTLDKYLEKHGYKTLNILYPSREMSLEDLTAFVTEKIENHPHYTPEKPLHFVTHSMGGLIARYYIATHKPKNLGKVVMLGPPNTGSDIDYPLGIIAGSTSINPLAPWGLKDILGEHDGVVPVERTKIDGMTDHIIIPATHSFMMFNPKAMKQVEHFLEDGHFNHS